MKIKRISRGAERWVNWEYFENSIDVINTLEKQGVEIVSMEISEKSIPYTKYIPSRPVCLVLGREYDGISDEFLNSSDVVIHLPILGMCNSINVSTAASVGLYHILEKLNK